MQAVLYTPEQVHLDIRIKAKKNRVDEVILHAYNTMAQTHKEEGCLEYKVFHNEDDVVLRGVWKNMMTLDMHLLLKYHLDLIEVHLPPLCKKIKVKVYKEIEPPITALSIG